MKIQNTQSLAKEIRKEGESWGDAVARAKAMKAGEKPSRMILIEEDKQWADKMQRVIARENLSDIAKVVHSPVSNADYQIPPRTVGTTASK